MYKRFKDRELTTEVISKLLKPLVLSYDYLAASTIDKYFMPIMVSFSIKMKYFMYLIND